MIFHHRDIHRPAQPIGRMAAVGFRSEDEKGYLNNQLGTVGWLDRGGPP
jgi:hypothetical protein